MRVTIADDHPLFLEGLCAWLTDIGIEVVGAARTADGVTSFAAYSRPVTTATSFRACSGSIRRLSGA